MVSANLAAGPVVLTAGHLPKNGSDKANKKSPRGGDLIIL